MTRLWTVHIDNKYINQLLYILEQELIPDVERYYNVLNAKFQSTAKSFVALFTRLTEVREAFRDQALKYEAGECFEDDLSAFLRKSVFELFHTGRRNSVNFCLYVTPSKKKVEGC